MPISRHSRICRSDSLPSLPKMGRSSDATAPLRAHHGHWNPIETSRCGCHIGRELQVLEEDKTMTWKRLMLVTLVAMLIALGAMGIRARSVAAASGQIPFNGSYSG